MFIIPDRHDEGYGVSERGISELEKLDVTLMITVDVGITALALVADAQSRGIDVIVTDHHAPLEILPGWVCGRSSGCGKLSGEKSLWSGCGIYVGARIFASLW